MTRRPKDIGTELESWVADHAERHWAFPDAKRPGQRGSKDEGDIWLNRYAMLECKAGDAAMDASDAQIVAWLEETERERVNAGARFGALVVKRRHFGRTKIGLMPTWLWANVDPLGSVELGCRTSPDGNYLTIPIRTTLDSALDIAARMTVGAAP